MPEWLNISITILAGLFMLVGLLGLIVPFFPGILVIWLAALGYGLATGFNTLGIVLFVIITLLMVLGSYIDNILMGVGARMGGAAWLTIGIAALAGITGTVLWPPLGGIIAAPLSVFILEWIRQRDFRKAWRAFWGLIGGWGASFLARFGIGVVMILLWGIWVYYK